MRKHRRFCRLYFEAVSGGTPEARMDAAEPVVTGVGFILACLLKADARWPGRERWVDGPADVVCSVEPGGRLRLAGKMTWGLLRDVGGSQWFEPFEVVIRCDRGPYRIDIGFGREPAVLIEGSYPSVVAEGANILTPVQSSDNVFNFEFSLMLTGGNVRCQLGGVLRQPGTGRRSGTVLRYFSLF